MYLIKDERIKLRDELIEQLKSLSMIAKWKDMYTIHSINAFFKKLKNYSKLQSQFDMYIKEFRSVKEGLYCLLHTSDVTEHLCPVCGKACEFYINEKRKKNFYMKTCGDNVCLQTLAHSEEANKKWVETNIRKYGKPYGLQSEEVKNKIKETNRKVYGNEHPMRNEKVKDKFKKTMLFRHKIEHALQSEKFRQKARQTWMKNYNAEHPMKCKEILDKMKETNRNRYGYECCLINKDVKAKGIQTLMSILGVDHPMKSAVIREKVRRTWMKKYNTEHPMKCKEILDKFKETNQKRYGYEYSLMNKDVRAKCTQTLMKNHNVESYSYVHIKHLDIWNDREKFTQFIIDKYNEKGMFLVLSDISGFFNVHPHNIKRKLDSYGLLNYFYIQDSNLEVQFKEFLEENNILYTRHNRSILKGNKDNTHKEIDFMCCDNKVGIEINDIWSHNTVGNDYYTYKDQYYHLNKSIDAKENGVHLIHIWEWELRNKDEWAILSRWILNLLNNSKSRIGARKCIIKKVLYEEEKNFLNEYHLQGYKKSEVCYGLYYNNELIQLMSFCKSRYNKNYQYELLQLCTKYGYIILGGANKLLRHFIKNYNTKSIISYCNLDKFTGKVYENIGFKLLKSAKPQIIWCNKDMKHFTNSSLNIIGADKLLSTNYGKGTSNEEIVRKHNYIPIYNCGLAVYAL